MLIMVMLALACLYLLLGLGFHIGWKRARGACRAEMAARGEFVEPEVFSEPLALAFDLTWWPVYAWANYYHDGTIFATPCTH
ncbi:MAG: hypothetical protein H5T61_03205 [Thermoflexales bacterium]|nr:hypothetical protein [Thermoflexales bacterium]